MFYKDSISIMAHSVYILLLTGLTFSYFSYVSTQQLSYGQRITKLNKLIHSVQKSQIITSEGNSYGEELFDYVRENWQTALLTIAAADHQEYTIASVSTTCINHLELIPRHLDQTWAQRSKYWHFQISKSKHFQQD